MDTEPKKKIYGLLGYPVKHSFSPAMHTEAFRVLNINAEYKPFEIKPEELDGFLHSLREQNIYGLNVTVPYKEQILDFVKFDKSSIPASYAERIGAVNTMAFKDNSWYGFNTDIAGFMQHLVVDNIDNIAVIGKRAAILGAGGAGRAVAYALAELKAAEIVIFDLDIKKAENVVKMIKDKCKNSNNIKVAVSNADLNIRDKDIFVNATMVGMKETDPCVIEEDMLHKNLFVYDLIYNPVETKLIKLAKKAGLKYANGLKMLLYQGMLSFEIWMGERAPQEVMWQALQKELVRCQT